MKKAALVAVALCAACSNSPPTIQTFTAAPNEIPVGSKTTLVFAAIGSQKMTLSIDNGVGDVTGLTQISVSPNKTVTYTLTATDGSQSSTATAQVKVDPAVAASFTVTAPASVTAGTAATVSVKALSTSGGAAAGYLGRVHFTSDDAQAALPADYTFTAKDSGVHAFQLTFKTSGVHTVVVQDTATHGEGAGQTQVNAGAAAKLLIVSGASAVAAGTSVPFTVTATDALGNLATSYTGKVTLTSTDGAAVMPPPATFSAQDAGQHTFAVAFSQAGSWTVTAKDAANSALTATTGFIAVTPAGTPNLLLTLPGDANASVPTTGQVSVADAYGNPITGYTGTVTLTSSDGAAVLPPAITFTAAMKGVAPVQVTFNTLGAQSLQAVDGQSTPGALTVRVHGFVYTNPPSALGKVQLVLNAAASSASLVQLDLVANSSLSPQQGANGSIRGGAYAAGMNLPLDTTRALADSTALVPGNVLTLGKAPLAVAASLPTAGPAAGVFSAGLSQKAAGAGAVTDDQALVPGQVFYSIRLKLVPTAAVGTVFDGNALGPQYRAAVRSITGSDVIGQADFGLGKLVVQ